MKKLLLIKILFPSLLITLFIATQVSTTIDDFFIPGSQPAVRTFEAPSKCDNCHSGISDNSDIAYEPVYGWQGSMMSQAMRDPLYLAALAIANQDAAFAGDLCIRCHAPAGWLSGRSTNPIDGNTSGDSLSEIDKEGVDCNFCHELINPNSVNPEDLVVLNALGINKPPFVNGEYQSGNGVFIIDDDLSRRHGPFDVQPASHSDYEDPYYQESAYCATCHDVSNPVFKKVTATDGSITYELDINAATKTFETYEMFPVERTYSEWTQSAYANGGVDSSVFGGNKTTVSTCQDCHMKDVTGYGANKNVPLRSDLPMHDMTGGNTFVPELIKQQYSTDPRVNTAALDAGILRARNMLQNAATMDVDIHQEEGGGYEAYIKITNETGHKLPSGYPEGRRMWIQLIAYNSSDEIVYESGAYDTVTAELAKQSTEYNNDTKIYEAKLAMSSAIEAASGKSNSPEDGSSFHFALNNEVVKDNRIPPRGFSNVNFEAIQAAPVGYTYEDGEYFDTTEYHLPSTTLRLEVKLLYQTTSKEYVEFLKNENITDNSGQILYDLWLANGKSTPEIMFEATFDTSTLATEDVDELLKNQFKVYPNPATEFVNVIFKLPSEEFPILEVYDITGKKIETLLKGNEPLTQKNIHWKTDHIPSGIYIVKLKYANKLKSSFIRIN